MVLSASKGIRMLPRKAPVKAPQDIPETLGVTKAEITSAPKMIPTL